MNLTKAQLRAVKTESNNTLVMASFGAGKTSSFVARIAYLIANKNVSPSSILGLTFTKDASNNMNERLKKAIGIKANAVKLTTFHSFAYQLLNSQFPEEYKKLSLVESWLETQIANDIVSKKNNYNKDGHDLPVNAGLFLDFIEYQKAHMIRKDDNVIINEQTPYFKEYDRPKVQSAFKVYCDRMDNANKISFSDMLLHTYYKLKENDWLVQKIHDKYQYVMVDEFQDTSHINFEILKIISKHNTYVVGDVNQSIYSFQQAEVGNIFRFIDEFDNVEVINLVDNFRSTQAIIDICNDLLLYRGEDNKLNKFGKQVCGRNIQGEPVKIAIYNNPTHEASDIRESILERMAENPELTYDDFCIISRTNNGLLAFENELSSYDIPVVIKSGSFYDRKEIDDLLSYAKLYLNDGDDDAFRKVFNRPNRFIPNIIIRSIEERAKEKEQSLEYTAKRFDAGQYSNSLNRYLFNISDIRKIPERNAEHVLRKIYEIIGYKYFIRDKAQTNSEFINKTEAIESLFRLAKGFSTVQELLNYVSIIKDKVKKNTSGVVLSTVHASKGLEWDSCYVVGITDDLYPHRMLLADDKDEELRLLFVAMGRAKNFLQISFPVYTSKEPNVLTRFLEPLLENQIEDILSDVYSGQEFAKIDYSH